MNIVFILAFVGIVFLLSAIPAPRKRFQSAISKYIGRKDFFEELISKLEQSKFMKSLVAKVDSEKYQKELIKLKRSGVKLSLEKMMIIRISISFFIIIIGFALYLNMNTLRGEGVLREAQSPSASAAVIMFGNSTADHSDSNAIYQSLLKKSIDDIPDYRKYIKRNDMASLLGHVVSVRDTLGMEDPRNEVAKKVVLTLKESYDVSHVTIQGVMIVILLGLLSSIILDQILKVLNSIRTRRIEKEFEKIEAVTILLLNKEQVSVISLLQQMKKQAKILRPYLQQCLNEYTSNPFKALDNLIEDVNNNEFTKFITIIKQCLSTEKDTNLQILKIQRSLRLAMQESFNKEKNRNKRLRLTLLQFPLILLLILLIMMPFLDIIKNSI